MTRILEGRTALITGAGQGFGLAVAHAYAHAGANIMMCGRNKDVLEKARDKISAMNAPGQTVVTQVADVSKRGDVENLVTRTLSVFPKVDILVNNAGIYGPMGLIETVNWEEWVRAIEINLLGSVLVCRAMVPHFREHHYGKIIQLSGGGATNPLPRISAYAASKAAIVRFAESLAEEVREDHIDVNSLAPGALNTRLLDEVLTSGPEKVGKGFYDRARLQKAKGGVPFSKGADLSIFLASAASDGITGKLLSAVWDPWEDLPKYLDNLKTTDIYTLRRIVPKDRGKEWGDRQK